MPLALCVGKGHFWPINPKSVDPLGFYKSHFMEAAGGGSGAAADVVPDPTPRALALIEHEWENPDVADLGEHAKAVLQDLFGAFCRFFWASENDPRAHHRPFSAQTASPRDGPPLSCPPGHRCSVVGRRAVPGTYSWRPTGDSVDTLNGLDKPQRWRLILAAQRVAKALDLRLEDPSAPFAHTIKYYTSVSKLMEGADGSQCDEPPMWMDAALAAVASDPPSAAELRYALYKQASHSLVGAYPILLYQHHGNNVKGGGRGCRDVLSAARRA